MRIVLALLYFFLSLKMSAQVLIDLDYYKEKLSNVERVSTLPEGLLSGKSAVIHVNDDVKNYKEQADIFQEGMKKARVDVVAHYSFRDIFSGTETSQAYLQQFADREIDFIIFYIHDDDHELLVKPLDNGLLSGTAFSIKNLRQKDLMKEFYLITANSGLEEMNNLIIDVAEFAPYPTFIEGRRGEFYNLNMKSGKVAIPLTDNKTINAEMDSIMKLFYPFEYGFVESTLEESDLRKEGYWFILYGIHSSGTAVRKLLEYEIKPGENAYTSVVADGRQTDVKTIDAQVPVYKFYIKHITSQDVFLGKHYDADEDWRIALKKYILNLSNILD